MNEFEEMLDLFQQYLKENTYQMVADITQMIRDVFSSETPYFSGYTCDDVANLMYEYCHEYLSITVFVMGNSLNEVTEAKALPTVMHENSLSDSYFIPKVIYEFDTNIDNEYDEKKYSEDEFYELFEEYLEQKTHYFEKWFCDCWRQATTQTTRQLNHYFSVHDSYFQTDLKTLKKVTDEEVLSRK